MKTPSVRFRDPSPYFFEMGAKKIAVTHSLSDYPADIIIFGHSHKPDIQSDKNGRLLVNPGESCGWVTGKSSVAILDLDSNSAEHIYF